MKILRLKPDVSGDQASQGMIYMENASDITVRCKKRGILH